MRGRIAAVHWSCFCCEDRLLWLTPAFTQQGYRRLDQPPAMYEAIGGLLQQYPPVKRELNFKTLSFSQSSSQLSRPKFVLLSASRLLGLPDTAYCSPINWTADFFLQDIFPYLGTMVAWHPANLVPSHPDTLVPWPHGTLALWYSGTLASWNPGTQVPWYPGSAEYQLRWWWLPAGVTC